MRTNNQGMQHIILAVAAMLLLCASAQRVSADGANSFTQTNLVSDIPGMAKRANPTWLIPGACRLVTFRRSGYPTTVPGWLRCTTEPETNSGW